MVLRRAMVVLLAAIASTAALVATPPAAVADAGQNDPQSPGGTVRGAVTCANNKNVTRVRIQAITAGTVEAHDAQVTIKAPFLWSADYIQPMSSIRGAYDPSKATKLNVYLYCNNQLAGGISGGALWPMQDHVWWYNMFGCDAGRCEA
jgi:hypothetical protein